MPYSKPKKRKCRKADGSSGSWVVDKELSSGKTEQSSCHDSEDKASASIRARKANEVDVPYGEEINEDIARILVKDFTLNEAKIELKHYSDSTETTGRPRPRNYMKWLEDGEPTSIPSAGTLPLYAADINNFISFRNNWKAFEVSDGPGKEPPRLYSLQSTGDPLQDAIDLDPGRELQLARPISQSTVSEFRSIMRSRKGVTPSVVAHVRLRNPNQEGYIAIADISHKLAGEATGKIKDKIIGQGVEHSVYWAIKGDGHGDEAIRSAIADPRNAAEYAAASLEEKGRFNDLILDAYDDARGKIGKFGFTDPTDPSTAGPTDKVDVPANTADGPAEIHVKFNDESRMFGLRNADKSEASPEFARVRNAILKTYVPTFSSYEMWIKKNPNIDPDLKADINDKRVVSVLKRFGKKNISQNHNPITKTTRLGSTDVFIDPRSLIKNMHLKSSKFQSGISSLMRLHPGLLSTEPFSEVVSMLERDVEKAISTDAAPGGIYYFNFNAASKLTVTSFNVPYESIKAVPHNSVEDNKKSLSTGYDIQVTTKGGNVFTPFHIQISSLARGKPLQVLKTPDLKKLLSINDSYYRSGKLITESKLSLIVEELTGADKSEIKRMIAKEIDSSTTKKMARKIFLAEFDREFKKMIDSKPLKDSIRSGVESAIKDKATKKEIAEVTKAVIKKLYRELSYSSVHIVDRIKI